jgi:flagellar biosynthesis protein FlhF
MIIKSFTAPTMAAALKKIREELGSEAIVLNSRTCTAVEMETTGHRFEITACIDEAAARKPLIKNEKKTGIDETGSRWQYSSEESSSEVTEKRDTILSEKDDYGLISVLKNADLGDELIKRWYDKISKQVDDKDNISDKALEIVTDDISGFMAQQVPIKKGSRIAFVGPVGSGKTSVMGKITARLTTTFKQKLKLVSLDNLNASSYNKAFISGDYLNISNPGNDGEGITDDDAILLIDTPAITGNIDDNIAIREKLRDLKPDIVFLVLLVTSRTDDVLETIERYADFTPDYLIATHLDESCRWGLLAAVPDRLNIPLAFITESPGGIGELITPEPGIIAQRLLNSEVENHG